MAGEKTQQSGTSSDAGAAAGNTTPNLGSDASATTTNEVPNLGTANNEGAAAGGEAPAKFELKLPEGFDKDPFFEKYEDFAKELGLEGEKSQKLADRYGTIIKAERDRVVGEARAQVEDWGKALQTDKELGGAKLKENFAVAVRGLEKFGTPELKQLLKQTGLGSHPEVVRAFYRAGKAVSDDSSAGRRNVNDGAAPNLNTDEALARQMYPDLY